MGESFVPVDLDKLLDDFEEQDSITSSGHCSQQPSSFLNGINKKGISSNDLLTSQGSSSLVNRINHKGASFNDVSTNGSATSISAHYQHQSLAVNGIDTEGISSTGLPRQNTPLAKSEDNHKDFKKDISSPADVTVADHSSLDVDLLTFDTVLDESNVNGDINSQSKCERKCDDHSEKNVNSKSYFPESLLPEKRTNNVQSKVEQPLTENVQILDLPNEDLSSNKNNKDQTTDQILEGNPSSVNDMLQCDSAVGSVWNDQISDVLLHGEAVCDDRFNQQTSSSVPFSMCEETPSLLFMQDHFSNMHLKEEVRDDGREEVKDGREEVKDGREEVKDGREEVKDGREEARDEPVFEEEASDFASGSSNNEAVNENSDAPLSNLQLTSQFIPVAQDAIAAEASLPLTNNNDISGPSGEIFQLGSSPPQWTPDGEASRCMNCHCKFTMVKRRHHCRACGKVFCSPCCNFKFNLQYLEYRLARVCQTCANALLQRQATLSNCDPGSVSSTDESAMYAYLSPEQQETAADAQLEQPSPAVIAEISPPGDQPLDYEGSHLDDPPMSHDACPVPTLSEGDVVTPDDSSQITQFRPTTFSSSSSISSADTPVTSTIPLPPLLRKTEEGLKIDNTPNHQEILYLLKKKKESVTFLLNKNLVVKVKIVKLNCCVKRKCWCFSSEGMGAADQEDMVILLECIPKESSIPQDVLSHFNTAFAYAKQGHRVTDLGYTIFGQPFLGSLRNAGFLYIKSSFQCLENLILPPGPHIFGVLIQREEVSWVQLFPIRLILRLGAEYRYYPCPLWSVRDRESLYGEIGHTIMDLLADFKNFQYTLPRVTGMHVHLEDKKTVIQLPQNRYDEVVKVLNATDEYVMAFEATFSNVADSHLVCIQDGTGYKTQAINIEGQERKVTGASFIVFNGALKTTNNVKAKVSIVEDGVMVQMVMQLSQDMRQAMREMSDFTINTGCADSDGGSVQEVVIEWVSKKGPDNESILSPIDGLTLGTTTDIKINTHFDYSTPSVYRLRWTQLFFLDRTEERPRNLSPHFKQTTAEIAKSCTAALRPYLPAMVQSGKRRIGLRVNLNPDMVGYSIGLQGTTLPDELTKDLDNELVPAINNAVNPSNSTPTSMEFVFNIIEMLS